MSGYTKEFYLHILSVFFFGLWRLDFPINGKRLGMDSSLHLIKGKRKANKKNWLNWTQSKERN